MSLLPPTLGVEHRVEVAVDARPSWLFDQLCDPSAVVACVPGAALTRVLDSQRFEANVSVGIGPLMVTCAGHGVLLASRSRRRIWLSLQGSDATAASHARAHLLATVGECAEGSMIQARWNLLVAGHTARFNRRFVSLVTWQLMEQTANRMRSRFGGQPVR